MKKLFVIGLSLISLSLKAATGDITGASVDPNGWFLKVYISGYGLGTNQANLGIATNGWLTDTSSIAFRVNTPGYTENLVSNNVAWTNYATFQRRADYPYQTNNYVQIVGSDAIVWFALAESLHAGDWIDWGRVRANTYSNNSAATLTLITNETTIPQPRVIMQWADVPHQLSGSSQTLYLSAYQAGARLGRTVRAVQFWAVDSSGNNTGTDIVTQPTTNNLWITTLSYANLTQGLTVSNHATVIPWFGNPISTADGTKRPDHPDYGPFITYNNKAGTWPVVIACVDPDSVSTGVAVTNWSLTTNGTMVPFADFRVAMLALGNTNNQFNSIATYENTFLLITNKPTRFGSTSGSLTSRTASLRPWTTVMGWPHLNMSNAGPLFVTASTDSQTLNQSTIKVKIENLNVNWTNNVNFSAQGFGHNWFNNVLVSSNGSGSAAFLCNFFTNLWITDSHFLGQRVSLSAQQNQALSAVRLKGNTFHRFSDGNTTTLGAVFAHRNRFVPATRSQYQFRMSTASFSFADPFIWDYNECYNHDDTAYLFGVALDNTPVGLTNGGVIAMNVGEGVLVGSGFVLDIAYSQKDNEVFTNLMVIHNTLAGVTHWPFDYGYTNVSRYGMFNWNNLYSDYEYRGDVLNTTNRGTNTIEILYSINGSGNSMFELNNNYIPPNNLGLGNSELGFNGLFTGYAPTNQSRIFFVDNRGYNSATTNAFGNYRLLPQSWVTRSSPSYKWVMMYDQDNRLMSSNTWSGAYAAPVKTTVIYGGGYTDIGPGTPTVIAQ